MPPRIAGQSIRFPPWPEATAGGGARATMGSPLPHGCVARRSMTVEKKLARKRERAAGTRTFHCHAWLLADGAIRGLAGALLRRGCRAMISTKRGSNADQP